MLAGLQGSGKTTLAGKLGRWLKSQGHTPLLVAADLQRPNAVQQLSVVGRPGRGRRLRPRAGQRRRRPDPGRRRLDRARPPHDARRRRRRHRRPARHRRRADGAGRRHPRRRPARRDPVRRRRDDRPGRGQHGRPRSRRASASPASSSPSSTATPAVARRSRCGTSPASRSCSPPPARSSTDFDVFHPERMASRILGMGDVLTLIEQAEQTFDADQAERMAGKLASREGFTLEDFLEQMMAIRKMGPIANLLGMLPGAGRDEGAAQAGRRPRPRPHRGDHPVDDARGAGQLEDHQRLAPGPDRQRLRGQRHRRQPAAGAVRRRPRR